MKPKGRPESAAGEPVAGNGILSRRIFLETALAAGAATATAAAAAAQPLTVEPWMKTPGAGFAPSVASNLPRSIGKRGEACVFTLPPSTATARWGRGGQKISAVLQSR